MHRFFELHDEYNTHTMLLRTGRYRALHGGLSASGIPPAGNSSGEMRKCPGTLLDPARVFKYCLALQVLPLQTPGRNLEYRALMLAVDEAACTEIQARLSTMAGLNEMHVAGTLSEMLPPGETSPPESRGPLLGIPANCTKGCTSASHSSIGHPADA